MSAEFASYAIVRGSSVEPLMSGAFRDADGILHSSAVLKQWDQAALAQIGVYPITAEPVPAGYRAVSSRLVFEDGAIIRRYTTEAMPPVDLQALKQQLKADIDAAAEVERHKYITPGSGQAMTYQAKATEAQRYADTGGAGVYPFLSREIGITGDTLADVASTVLAMHQQWLVMGAEIEQVRLEAKAQIDTAEDEAAARTVQAGWGA